MKRTIVIVTLVALAMTGCSKFWPSALHRPAKSHPQTTTVQPAAHTAAPVKATKPNEPAAHVAHRSDKTAVPSKSSAEPASRTPAGTSAGPKS